MSFIDLAFQIEGSAIPFDHGYSLYSAISRIVPSAHEHEALGIHPIHGARGESGCIALTKGSRLRLRLREGDLAPFLALAGEAIEIDGHRISIGIPKVEPLIPAAVLGSPLVTVRGMVTPEALLESLRKSLDGIGVGGVPGIAIKSSGPRVGEFVRRIVSIKGKRIVGFSAIISGLEAEASLRLQEVGLGGRRRMGCGVLVPLANVRAGIWTGGDIPAIGASHS